MRIGITGGIGCGKSYVSHLLSTCFGIPVYDSDYEAKRLMNSSAIIHDSLVTLLGAHVYDSSGSLQKAVVADYLFASEEHAQTINAIVHPVVKADFIRWAQTNDADDAAFESAILVQAGFRDVVDCLLVVTAPESLRLSRTMARDGASEQQIRARMALQVPEDELVAVADYVIVNDGRDLMSQLKEFYTFIHKENSTCSKQS